MTFSNIVYVASSESPCLTGVCEETKAADERANGLERLSSLKGMFAFSDSAVKRIYFGEYKEYTRRQKSKRQQTSLIEKFARASDKFLIASVFDRILKYTADAKRAHMVAERKELSKRHLLSIGMTDDNVLLRAVLTAFHDNLREEKAARQAERYEEMRRTFAQTQEAMIAMHAAKSRRARSYSQHTQQSHRWLTRASSTF